MLRDNKSSSENFIKKAYEEYLKLSEVDIVNMSFYLRTGGYHLIKDIFKDNNFIQVASAGENELLLESSVEFRFPAMDENVISVGAISKDFFQNHRKPNFNKQLDYVLFLNEIVSCSINIDERISSQKGSSQACAMISGLSALIAKDYQDREQVLDKVELIKRIDEISTFYSDVEAYDEHKIIIIKPDRHDT